MKAYVVTGDCGEYSDKVSWIVAVSLDKDKACARSNELNQWCIDNNAAPSTIERSNYAWPRSCPLDPQFSCDYTGTWYGVDEVEFIR
jgi:hypothetical protein